MSSLSSTLLRVSGISSGLDTESIVESLLSIDQSKIDKQNQLITALEWKSEALEDIKLQIKTFRETYFSVLSDDNMLETAAYNTYNVTLLDSSSAVSISAGANADEGTMTINSITQLATAASASSTSIFNTELSTTNTALKDLDLGTALTFDASGEISFSINGETFTFSEDDMLSDVISEINNSDAGVTMKYSSLKQGFTFTADETGSSSTVEIVNISGNAFDSTSSAFGISEGTYTGQDAILEIEGISVTKSSNTFTIDGISYTLKDTTATEVSFSIERDVQSTVDRITTFISAYNDLVDSLQGIVDEDVYYSYDPLTDEQRESLTEDQADKWDEMAKSGQLRNDSALTSLLSSLRNSFYTAVEGAGLSASEIGLTTGSYADQGKIYIDEDVLTEAIQANPDKIESLFYNYSYDEDSAVQYSESGLMNRISELMNSYVKTASSNAISSVETQLSSAEDRLDTLEDLMAAHEERLWAKFTAMETALATMNAQASSLLSALGYSTSDE